MKDKYRKVSNLPTLGFKQYKRESFYNAMDFNWIIKIVW